MLPQRDTRPRSRRPAPVRSARKTAERLMGTCAKSFQNGLEAVQSETSKTLSFAMRWPGTCAVLCGVWGQRKRAAASSRTALCAVIEYVVGYVVVSDGRIVQVGSGAAPTVQHEGARVVDGSGCLTTPGLAVFFPTLPGAVSRRSRARPPEKPGY